MRAVRAFDAPGSSTASRLLNISRSCRLQLLFIYVSFIIAINQRQLCTHPMAAVY
jgi:hypothetical protein